MDININQNTITYTGNVKIKIFKNGEYFKTIYNHNAGTLDFLKFIRDCVAGKSGIYSRTPFYLEPFYNDVVLAGNSFSGYVTQDTSSEAKIIYTFLLSGINYPSNTQINGFNLKSVGVNGEIYATMNIPSGTTIILDDTSNIYVEWTLAFTAAPDETD